MGWDNINIYHLERTKEDNMRKMQGSKAQSRIQTSYFKLERPVPYLIGHTFVSFFVQGSI